MRGAPRFPDQATPASRAVLPEVLKGRSLSRLLVLLLGLGTPRCRPIWMEDLNEGQKMATLQKKDLTQGRHEGLERAVL